MHVKSTHVITTKPNLYTIQKFAVLGFLFNFYINNIKKFLKFKPITI